MLTTILLCLITPFNIYAAASSSSGYAATSTASDAPFRFSHGSERFSLTKAQCASSRMLDILVRDVDGCEPVQSIQLTCIQTLGGYGRARRQGADRLFEQAQLTGEFRSIDRQNYERDLPMLAQTEPEELDTTPHGRLFNYIKIELNGKGLTDQDWESGAQDTLVESGRAYAKMFALLQDPALNENRDDCDIARIRGLMGEHLQTYSSEEGSIIELADVATVCFDTLEVFNDAGVAVAVRAYNLGILQDLRPGNNVLTRKIAIRMINMYKKYYLALLRAGQQVERFPLLADISPDDLYKAGVRPLLFQSRPVNPTDLDMHALKLTSLRGIEKIPELKEVVRLDLSHNSFVELQQYMPMLPSRPSSDCSFTDSDSESDNDDEMPISSTSRNEGSDDIDFYLPNVPKRCLSERWFEGFGILTHLDLSNNLLREVPLLPRSLKHLNLNNNRIENIERLLSIDGNLLALPSIETLKVRSNYISAGNVSRLIRAYGKKANLTVQIFPQYSASYIGTCASQVTANLAVMSGLALLFYKKVL